MFEEQLKGTGCGLGLGGSGQGLSVSGMEMLSSALGIFSPIGKKKRPPNMKENAEDKAEMI